MFSRRLFLASAALSLALGGCQLLPQSVQNLRAVSADNPLNGQPLHWSRVAEGVPFEGEKACTMWPLENELTITATDAEVCAKGRVYRLVGAQFGDPGTHSLGVSSDGSGDSGLVAGNAGPIEAKGSRKVGQCIDHDTAKSIWEEPFDGCTANKDPAGKPALTKQSTFLQVGDARWKFPTPAAPAQSASAK